MRRVLLVLLMLLCFSPVATAAEPTIVYLPLVSDGRAPTPVPDLEFIPINSPVYIYGAVQPSVEIDRDGLWWSLEYVIRDQPAGSYLFQFRPGDAEKRLVYGSLFPTRGSLVVGCDQHLYAVGYTDNNYIAQIVRINTFPGPARPVVCTPTTVRRVEVQP